jgi:REP element-mobilizing transposase RayT
MARPLRIDVADGWYHVTARGIERRAVFADRRDHEHFLELLEETVQRFRVVLHAHVEMDNHYHLITQTPEANLSRAIQWLNVSYVAWFNRRHDRVGPLFQGRFKSIPVQDGAWAYELSLYVHLNPVMIGTYGLNKRGKKAESQGLALPDRQTVTRRLSELRQYPWSSYRAYAGYVKAPAWLQTGEILQRADRREDQRMTTYRQDVTQRMAMGVDPEFKERLADGFALGTEAFRTHVRKIAKGGREVTRTRELRSRISFPELVRLVETLRGQKADDFLARRGDWARPLLLWAARQYTGMTLQEIGSATGGMDYTAVAMAIKRFEQRAANYPPLRRRIQQLKAQCEM